MRDDFILLLKTLKQLSHHPLRIQIRTFTSHVVRVIIITRVLEIRWSDDFEAAVNRSQAEAFAKFGVDIQDQLGAVGFAECGDVVEGLEIGHFLYAVCCVEFVEARLVGADEAFAGVGAVGGVVDDVGFGGNDALGVEIEVAQQEFGVGVADHQLGFEPWVEAGVVDEVMGRLQAFECNDFGVDVEQDVV